MVFLPGRGSDPEEYVTHGFVDRVHAWSTPTDVLLVDAHLGYYYTRTLPERFEQDVLPAIEAREYDEVWVVGISLGGLGSLFLDRDFPGVFDRLILLAPFLGDDAELFQDLTNRGLDGWRDHTAELAGDSFQYDLWTYLQANRHDPTFRDRLWMGYGEEDRYAEWHALLAPLVPAEQLFRDPSGDHTWPTWERLWARIAPALETVSPPPARE